MSATMTATRTITGRHPVTGEPIPVRLADNETMVGIHTNGMPLVRCSHGMAGSTFGVIYVIDDVSYDDLEAFDPLGIGSF